VLALKRNEDGYIVAYAEYRIVNQDGKDNDKGLFCYIRDCWVHPKHKGILKELIKQGHEKYPQVIWIYWKRSKHGGRMKMFEIRKLYA
jgi:hypothetical protein